MKLVSNKIVTIVCSICIMLFVCGCGIGNTNETLNWTVSVQEYKIVDGLESVDDVRQYDGSIAKVPHKNVPSKDNVFVLLNLDVKKNVSGNHPLVWDNLILRDSNGNSYSRMQDVFLTDYKYDRLPATDLKLDGKGWICFEVPADAAKKLKLIYSENDKQNIMEFLK